MPSLGGDRYDYDIDCGDSFIGIHLFPNLLCCLIFNAYISVSDIQDSACFRDKFADGKLLSLSLIHENEKQK